MLTLHALVRGAITSVNPDQSVIILQSDGFDVADYEQRPKWKEAVSVKAQCQPVADKTIQLLNQQRQNSIWWDFYLEGDWNSLMRSKEKSGDLLYWNGFEWQVDQVLEAWAPTVGWTKLRCIQVRQSETPELGSTEPPRE